MNRRDILAAGATGLGLVGDAAIARPSGYPEPALAFVFEAQVLLGPIRELGTIDGIRRRIVPIVGGTVVGSRLTGTISPGGADWQGIRPSDGLTRVSARYWMTSDDGVSIGIENVGIRRAPLAIMKRILAGDAVPPDAYYFRTSPCFEVGAGRYQWLNETVFVAVGARLPDRAIIRVYAVS